MSASLYMPPQFLGKAKPRNDESKSKMAKDRPVVPSTDAVLSCCQFRHMFIAKELCPVSSVYIQ